MGVMELRAGTETCLPPNQLRVKVEPRKRLGLPNACNKQVATPGGEPSPPNPPAQCSFLDTKSLKSEPLFLHL